METPKVIVSHVTDSNRDTWALFLRATGRLGFSRSKALECAAVTWLKEQGYWENVLVDPGPGRMTRVKPINRGDFDPVWEWAEVAPYVDRWTSPPMVVLPGPDGRVPRVGDPCESFPAGVPHEH
jgi:hypothetical protein